MAGFSDHIDFARTFAASLPSLNRIEARSEEFWNVLEVNAPTVIEEMVDPAYVESKLASLDTAGKQIICFWTGFPPLYRNQDIVSLARHISANRGSVGFQTIMLICDFLYRRRPDAIETISHYILPEEQFNSVFSTDIESNSKRFCYTILAFTQEPHLLRTLMLFESAERAGYTRYHLIPRPPDINDADRIDELMKLAEERIEQGVDLRTLDVGRINGVLEKFERRHGQKESLCFDIFIERTAGVAIIFILRPLRGTFIREVDGIIFAEEAELIVLRVYEGMRIVDEHSAKGIGIQIATEIATEFLGIENLQFIKSSETIKLPDLQNLIQNLMNESDDRLKFREIYLETAPIEGSPKLVIRSEEDLTIVGALKFLKARGVDLLLDLRDVKNVKIGFIVDTGKELKSYSFKIFLIHLGQNLFFLPYSTANIAIRIRENFEAYLKENYNVQIFPGKG